MMRIPCIVFGVVVFCGMFLVSPVEAQEPHGGVGERGGQNEPVPIKDSSSPVRSDRSQDAEKVMKQEIAKPRPSSRCRSRRNVGRRRASRKHRGSGSRQRVRRRQHPEPVSEERVVRVITKQLKTNPRRSRKGRVVKKWRNESQQVKRMKKLMTRRLGAGPILQHFISKMGVMSLIDECVPAHESRKVSHGEAVAALMVYLLCGERALYRMEQWAETTAILSTLFPAYEANDWTDDRLGDTLDALYSKGLEGIQGSLSARLVEVFEVCLEVIHYDTTSVSFWGTYDAQRDQPAVLITFGYSKAHRPDLKQVVLGAAVSGDGGVPLLSKTHAGNSNDSTLPVPYWERLRQLCKTSQFCFIGDCKVSSQKTLTAICTHDGLFVSPFAMSTAEQKSLRQKLQEGTLRFEPLTQEEKKTREPVYEKRTERVGNRRKPEGEQQQADTYEVSEETSELRDDHNRVHTIRRLILRSASLGRKHANTRERHLHQAEAELKELRRKLNKRTLKTRQAIETAIKKIVSHRRVVGLLDVPVTEEREVVTKQVGPGRPGPNTTYVDEELVSYDLSMTRPQEKIDEKALLDGMFMLVTNHDAQEWPASRVLALYKRQYKVERVFHVLKGPLAVSPMLLEQPERICAMMFIMTLTLQLYTLIQREAAKELARRDRPLSGLMPNKIQTWRPQTDQLLVAFDNIHVVGGYHNGVLMGGVTTLNATQTEILQILGVSLDKYAFT